MGTPVEDEKSPNYSSTHEWGRGPHFDEGIILHFFSPSTKHQTDFHFAWLLSVLKKRLTARGAESLIQFSFLFLFLFRLDDDDDEDEHEDGEEEHE